jgi:hypothetical protein
MVERIGIVDSHAKRIGHTTAKIPCHISYTLILLKGFAPGQGYSQGGINPDFQITSLPETN